MKRFPQFVSEHADVASIGLHLHWQRGFLADGVNGATPDLVVRALIRKFELFQQQVPCSQNAAILVHLHSILHELDYRTRERQILGVLGTDKQVDGTQYSE